MDLAVRVPIIYNLFPRLAGIIPAWRKHVERAADMGFNWLFINSILYPGFSGSLYAIKDYYRVNSDFLPQGTEGNGLAILEQTLRTFTDMGVLPVMDLVINHTAKDNPLTETHPEWYVRDKDGKIVSPFACDPDDLSKKTVWGDLAEIDNEHSADKDNLWAYWAELVRFYLRLGFRGFRCDAAYKVPAELWKHLVSEAARVTPEAVFFAEILGSTEEQALALEGSGLHYFFNSSKWWDFTAPWCLEQHEAFGKLAPSISFPETHDTTRLAGDTGGNEVVQRQRYAFAAVFSAGLMMPIGYELGFKKQLNVVTTRPEDWETPGFDLTQFVHRVNSFKKEQRLFQGEGHFIEKNNEAEVLVLERRTGQMLQEKGWVLVNKDLNNRVSIPSGNIAVISPQHRLYRLCRNDSPISGESVPQPDLVLNPAEVVAVSGE